MTQPNRKPNFLWPVTLLVLVVSVACLYLLTIPDFRAQSQQSGEVLTQNLRSGSLVERVTESAMTGGRAKGGTFSAPAPSRSLPSSPSGG